MDIRELHRRAVTDAGAVVGTVRADDLTRPTPCAGWDLGFLLRHMVGLNDGFAAGVRGAEPDPAVWDGAGAGDDPVAAWDASALDVVAAFAEPDALDRTVHVYQYNRLPAQVAIRMHLVDALVHGWDVARALGRPGDLDGELCAAALEIATGWPDRSWSPTGPFRDRVAAPAGASPTERVVALFGRAPQWPAGSAADRS